MAALNVSLIGRVESDAILQRLCNIVMLQNYRLLC